MRNLSDDVVVINPNPDSVTPEILCHKSPFTYHYCINILVLFLYLSYCILRIRSHKFGPRVLTYKLRVPIFVINNIINTNCEIYLSRLTLKMNTNMITCMAFVIWSSYNYLDIQSQTPLILICFAEFA